MLCQHVQIVRIMIRYWHWLLSQKKKNNSPFNESDFYYIKIKLNEWGNINNLSETPSFTDGSSILMQYYADEDIYYYEYPKTKKLDDISFWGYSGDIDTLEITEELDMVGDTFRAFQQIRVLKLSNAIFNLSCDANQIFNFAPTELYVPYQPVCQLEYLNLYNSNIDERSIENVSYWLRDATNEPKRYVSFPYSNWNSISLQKRNEIENRITSKNWEIVFDDCWPYIYGN